MGRLPAAIRAGVIAAGVAGFLFWLVNRSVQVNGVGLLRRQGGSVGDPWVWVAAGFALGFVGSLMHAARQAAHARAARTVASERACEYAEVYALPPGAGALPLFAGWSDGRNAMTGTADGVPVALFDCTTIQKGDESDAVTDRTVALLPAVGLPDFDLRPRTLGQRMLEVAGLAGLTFDPDAAGPADAEAVRRFVETFHLSAGDPLAALNAVADGCPPDWSERETRVRRFFTPARMTAVNAFPAYGAQVGAGYLAVWLRSGVLSAGLRPKLWDAALAIRAALLQPFVGSGPAPVPARAGTDVEAQARRLRRTTVGGVVGLFAGFAVSAVIIALLFFGWAQHDGMPSPKLLVLPVIFFGLTIGGGLAGAWIGSRRPDTASGPSEDPVARAARVQAVRRWTMAGLFVGFIGGGIAFMASKVAFDWRAHNFGVEAAVFFGSLFGGTGLGAWLGSRFGGRPRSR